MTAVSAPWSSPIPLGKDEHRAHLLRVHQEKRGILEAERLKWQQEREEVMTLFSWDGCLRVRKVSHHDVGAASLWCVHHLSYKPQGPEGRRQHTVLMETLFLNGDFAWKPRATCAVYISLCYLQHAWSLSVSLWAKLRHIADNFCARIATLSPPPLPSLNPCAQSNLSKPKHQSINCYLKTRVQTNARVEEVLSHATQEHTEALRRQRMAHDAEMRKAGEDILRLEREIRRLKVTRFLSKLLFLFRLGIFGFLKILGSITILCSVSLIRN